MMATRRLALSLLCAAAPLTAALMTASPAVADDPAQAEAACGASAADYAGGPFLGSFASESGAALQVRFAAPNEVQTQWREQGWEGAGVGRFEVGPGSVQWTNSATVSGPLTGVDSEVYRSAQVQCEAGGSRVTSIAGVVDSGDSQIPFVVHRG